MTPKQKAEKLVQHYQALEVSVTYMDLESDISIAKNNMLTKSACECALHCTAEVIGVIIDFPYIEEENQDKEIKYWEQVRSEILIIAST